VAEFAPVCGGPTPIDAHVTFWRGKILIARLLETAHTSDTIAM
jgi:hypothetical protein